MTVFHKDELSLHLFLSREVLYKDSVASGPITMTKNPEIIACSLNLCAYIFTKKKKQ